MAETTGQPVAPKSGIFTTEFWTVVATIVVAALKIIPIPPIIVGAVVALYGFERTYIKAKLPAALQTILDSIEGLQPKTSGQ